MERTYIYRTHRYVHRRRRRRQPGANDRSQQIGAVKCNFRSDFIVAFSCVVDSSRHSNQLAIGIYSALS